MSYPNNSNTYLPNVVNIPSALEITAISNSNPMVITTTYDATVARNTYIEGQVVKLLIPFGYGMQQANGLVAQITGISGSDITVDINSTKFDVFSVPIGGEQPASLSPYGSRNLQFNNTTGQVPFQAFNNVGN